LEIKAYPTINLDVEMMIAQVEVKQNEKSIKEKINQPNAK
jgi:hypothetical protein